MDTLSQLRDRWRRLASAANAAADTPDRRMARRIQRGLAIGAVEGSKDPAYLKIIQEYGPARR